jgi:hypothetical protein
MTRINISILLIILMVIASYYINYQIEIYNMDYYYGKDNGAFRQLESIIIFSTLFYLIVSKSKKIIFTLLGLFIGVLSGIVTYLITGTGLSFPLFACLIQIILFFILEKMYFVDKKASR